MTIVLDIETVPTQAALAAPYPDAERTPPANYKSDEAIAKWREADRAKWAEDRVKECSLNPRLGRVLCVGTINLALGTESTVLTAVTEADEAALLLRTFDRLAAQDGKVVTWNGAWDLHFLLTRALVLGVDPAIDPALVRGWFRRYQYAPHFDCKAVLTQWAPPTKGEGLDAWATALGVPGKADGLSGGDVWRLFEAGQLAEIAAYCAQDVATTLAIYDRLRLIYGGIVPHQTLQLVPQGAAVPSLVVNYPPSHPDDEPLPWEVA